MSAVSMLQGAPATMHVPSNSLNENAFKRGPWGKRLFGICQLFGLVGGVLFIALVVMSIVSITGRKLFSLPVPGDIEIMQMGTAVASAAMLAYCEMSGNHLKVDFFTARLSGRTKLIMDGIAHLLVAVVAALIAWRTLASALASREAGETSLMLDFPVWWAVAAMTPSFILFSVAAMYNAVCSFQFRHVNGEQA